MDGFLKAMEYDDSSGPLEFNFCKSLHGSGATCNQDVYAGLTKYIGNTTIEVCDEDLSGEVSSQNTGDVISFSAMTN